MCNIFFLLRGHRERGGGSVRGIGEKHIHYYVASKWQSAPIPFVQKAKSVFTSERWGREASIEGSLILLIESFLKASVYLRLPQVLFSWNAFVMAVSRKSYLTFHEAYIWNIESPLSNIFRGWAELFRDGPYFRGRLQFSLGAGFPCKTPHGENWKWGGKQVEEKLMREECDSKGKKRVNQVK